MTSAPRAVRILVVEDDDDDFALLSRTFRLLPFSVEPSRASTDAELVAALTHEGVDVILCDLHLPGFSGIDAQSIAERLAPSTPFLVVTGAISAAEAREWGERKAFAKTDVAALLDTLVDIVHGSREQSR